MEIFSKKLTRSKLANMMECGRLEPYSTKTEIIKLCDDSKKYNFGVTFSNLNYIPLIVNELKDTSTKIGIPIAFPFGATSSEIKIKETKQAIEEGADEVDMVMNIQKFKSGDYNYVKDDIEGVVKEAKNIITKVIIEACYLTKDEIVKSANIIKESGAKFVKTSTGYGTYSARLTDIILIKENVDIGIKAASDIEDIYTCLKMIEAGATRIGANPEDAIHILEQYSKL